MAFHVRVTWQYDQVIKRCGEVMTGYSDVSVYFQSALHARLFPPHPKPRRQDQFQYPVRFVPLETVSVFNNGKSVTYIIDDFIYFVNKRFKNREDLYLRCREAKRQCSASCLLTPESCKLMGAPHNHGPPPDIERYKEEADNSARLRGEVSASYTISNNRSSAISSSGRDGSKDAGRARHSNTPVAIAPKRTPHASQRILADGALIHHLPSEDLVAPFVRQSKPNISIIPPTLAGSSIRINASDGSPPRKAFKSEPPDVPSVWQLYNAHKSDLGETSGMEGDDDDGITINTSNVPSVSQLYNAHKSDLGETSGLDGDGDDDDNDGLVFVSDRIGLGSPAYVD